jgi:hypothetical protein
MPLVKTKVKMKILIVLFTLVLSLTSSAQDTIKIKKVDKNSNKKFIISKVNAKKIYIFSNERLKAIAIIKKCNKSSCLAIITKQKKGFIISKTHEVLLTKKYKSKSFKETQEMFSKQRSKEEPPVEKNLGLIYGGFGGPFSNAIIAGYKTGHNSNWSFDLNAGSIMYPIGNIKMTGMNLGLGINYKLINKESFKMSAVYSYNMSTVELDFTNININAANEETSLSSHMLGGEMTYTIGESFTTGLSIGYSITDIKDSYAATASENISIPFSSGLIYIGFLVGFVF